LTRKWPELRDSMARACSIATSTWSRWSAWQAAVSQGNQVSLLIDEKIPSTAWFPGKRRCRTLLASGIYYRPGCDRSLGAAGTTDDKGAPEEGQRLLFYTMKSEAYAFACLIICRTIA